MNRPTDPRLWLAIAGAALALAAWLGLLAGLLVATLEPAEQTVLAGLLMPRLGLLAVGWLLAAVLLAGLLRWLHRRHVTGARQLLENLQAVIAAPGAQPIAPPAASELAAIARAVNALAAQRDQLRAEVDDAVTRASHRLQQERNRLAALMAELPHSVVVCNAEGRVLLYNQHAREQFRALSQGAQAASGAELLGIGRSIYAVLDPAVLAHALERVQQALSQGVVQPTAQCVTATEGGQLLRVQVAPVPAVADDTAAAAPAMEGYVLMLDNVTQSVAEESERDQLLHGLTEGSRASLANIQAAVDMLGYADLEPGMRERFLAVVRDEVGTMGRRVTDLAQRATQRLKTRWPLEDMRGDDLLTAAQRSIAAQCHRPVSLDGVDDRLWMRVDSYTLLQALAYLACRLVDEFDVRFLQLRLQSAGAHAQLDLVWTGQAMSNETVMSWEMDAMRFGAESTPLSVRDVVDRHGGEMWFERDRVRHQAFFRLLLPLATAPAAAPVVSAPGPGDAGLGARPEFYDFDLFRTEGEAGALDDRPLADLAYTVFDTETTGLNPAGGDALLQIGAVRIVNGRLLRHESFEQLVNPGRPIPAASIPIHGITEDMVLHQPRIGAVLPVFHAFAQDTVLVAHNAAFDMRFLQLQEAATGVGFRQPVLDTLLLSAVVHPNQESHRLEAIAERLHIPVVGRHTALGDALVTAQIWLRLIPLLQAQGIHTLGQAREAAQRTYYARLKY